MMNLNIKKNNFDYEIIEITTDEGSFQISFENVGDLYWYYEPTKSLLDSPNQKKFTITKENQYLYESFVDLFNAIEKNKPFYNSSFNDEMRNKKISLYNSLKQRNLMKNNIIEWHSDDSEYDKSSILFIEKQKDKFSIIFEKSKVDDLELTFAVRFRNSGSLYEPYNISFMNMYNKLKKYDNQISIEEYMYNKENQKTIKKTYNKKDVYK